MSTTVITCPWCSGSGWTPSAAYWRKLCTACNGRGVRYVASDPGNANAAINANKAAHGEEKGAKPPWTRFQNTSD